MTSTQIAYSINARFDIQRKNFKNGLVVGVQRKASNVSLSPKTQIPDNLDEDLGYKFNQVNQCTRFCGRNVLDRQIVCTLTMTKYQYTYIHAQVGRGFSN